ncbi:restriction endonuclease subunit S [Aromatoleum toluclasticum]|uniref:restriction endonuclease subunit S n=1 Tax=Aromatoleum toluclasticum TaxID=92003 RepID=UPI0012F76769|nr:restriction endonuclease subunit S [Aromatoleum toluclasticum]
MNDSRVSWPAEIPASWNLIRIKDLAILKSGDHLSAEQINEDGPYPVMGGNGLRGYSFRFTHKGEHVLIGRQGALCGNINYAKGPFWATEHAVVAQPRRTFILRWLGEALRALNLNQYATASAQPGLSVEVIANKHVPVPPLDEQRRIAAWLDLQTGRVDKRLELLGKKRELLRELKNSVIEDATFRGLNADAAQRESDIDWLGAIPAHWAVVRLGSLFREAADAGIDGLPMLSVSIHSGISDKELEDDELDRKVSRSEDRTLYKRVKPGDLVYNQMRAWQGAFGAAKVEGLVSPAYVVARPGTAVVPTFIEYLLRAPAAMEEIRCRSRGITDFRLRLYWDEFKNIRVALPPKDEQAEIAAFLDRKLSQIARQIALIDRLEALLKEQRKAMIHEAVTGKIDLSAYEPQQPREALAA